MITDVDLIGKSPCVPATGREPWYPAAVTVEAPVEITFRSFPGEKRLYRRKRPQPIAEWAAKYRKITYGPLKGSYFDPHFMPHMAGIMDCAAAPCVREVVNLKAPQTGGSANWETFLANRADMSPGDTLIVYPDRDTAAKRCKDYLQPMFTTSPRLADLLTGVADDMASLRVKLQTMLIYMGWSGSVTSIGNVSVRYLLVDELDKCATAPSKKEASFEELVSERTTAFDKFGSLKIWNSTPTEAPSRIVAKFRAMDIRCDYHVRCPECGELQRMEFESIDFAGERDPEKMERERLARYVCSGCGVLWDDRLRDLAVRQGEWMVRDDGRPLARVLEIDRPARVGFHSPAWISPLNSLSKCAAAFLRGVRDREQMLYFDTQIKATEHHRHEKQRQEDVLLALIDDRPEGLVPGGGVVAALVCGSDTQDNGHYYWIDAVGYGLEQERWLISAGFVETEEALESVVFGTDWMDAAGNVYPVRAMVKDSGGHKTSEVYDFCLRDPLRRFAYKGASGKRSSPFTTTRVDHYPGSNRPIPGGVTLYTCDSHYYKDLVSSKLSIKPSDPGAWHMDQGFTQEQAQQLCAEYRDGRGLWQCPSGRANHHWDSAVMAVVASDILKLKFWPKPETAAPKPIKPKKANPYTGGRPLFGGR